LFLDLEVPVLRKKVLIDIKEAFAPQLDKCDIYIYIYIYNGTNEKIQCEEKHKQHNPQGERNTHSTQTVS
jgi:hypothetical protein